MKFVVFIAETYVQLVVTDLHATLLALSMLALLRSDCYCRKTTTELTRLVLYCTMPFIATCVDAIGMVFWDHPVLRYPGKVLILVAKAVAFTLADTQIFNWLILLYFQWGSLGPLRMVGKLTFYMLGCDEVILLDSFDFLCNVVSMRSTISIL